MPAPSAWSMHCYPAALSDSGNCCSDSCCQPDTTSERRHGLAHVQPLRCKVSPDSSEIPHKPGGDELPSIEADTLKLPAPKGQSNMILPIRRRVSVSEFEEVAQTPGGATSKTSDSSVEVGTPHSALKGVLKSHCRETPTALSASSVEVQSFAMQGSITSSPKIAAFASGQSLESQVKDAITDTVMLSNIPSSALQRFERQISTPERSSERFTDSGKYGGESLSYFARKMSITSRPMAVVLSEVQCSISRTPSDPRFAIHLIDKLIFSGLSAKEMEALCPEKAADVHKHAELDNCRRTVLNGSYLLIIALALMFVVWVFDIISGRSDCDMFSDDHGYRVLCVVIGASLWPSLIMGLYWCRYLASRKRVYWRLYCLCTGLVMSLTLLIFIPPLGLSCDDLIKVAQCRNTAFHYSRVAEVGCGTQGTTAMMAFISVSSLSPFILPKVNHVAIFAAIHVAGWCICNIFSAISFGKLHTWVDVVCALGISIMSATSSFYAKAYLVRNHNKSYKIKYFRKDAGLNLLGIFECMVPLHVVVPMLTNSGNIIAQHVDIASILFVLIDSFDEQSRDWEPRQVLDYLNDVFSSLDFVCDKYGVMKIETVSEEFVAAVGVVEEKGRASNHADMLGDAVQAAIDMFELQPLKQVVFRMGLHTGSVVGGVIGDKLPRFRLFGDTMNTAARMMQKGLPSELQFSAQTKSHIPDWVFFAPRGPIEMKGKGMVETFLLDWKNTPRRAPSISVSERNEWHAYHSCRSMESMDTYLSYNTFITPPGSDDANPQLSKRMSHNAKFNAVIKAVDTDWRLSAISGPISGQYESERDAARRSTLHNSLRSSLFGDISSAILNVFASENHSGSIRITPSWFSAPAKSQSSKSPGLSEDEAVEFAETYYRIRLTNKTTKARLQITVLAALSCFECPLAGVLDSLDGDYELVTAPRYIVFLFFRAFAVLIFMCWFRFAGTAMYEIPILRAVQLRTATACVFLVLLFFSYEALTPKLRTFTSALGEDEIKRILSDDTHHIRMFPLMFFFVFCSITFNLRLPGRYAFVFACFASIFIGVTSRRTFFDLDFTMEYEIDQVVCFSIVGLLGALKACLDENKQKANFKQNQLASFTHLRMKTILDSLLPPLVLEEIRTHLQMPSHRYQHATIAQCDLVGFTALASTRQPTQVVEIIGQLFGIFDDITHTYRICKLETVGDAYIAGQAEPPLTLTYNPLEVVKFAMEITQATQEWSQKRAEMVSCRVGVHTGTCIGGIVGVNMQRYHLFGSLLTALESLESTSAGGKVQISKACYEALKPHIRIEESDHLVFEPRVGEHLTTSKGDTVEFEAVGGRPTYFVQPAGDLACLMEGRCSEFCTKYAAWKNRFGNDRLSSRGSSRTEEFPTRSSSGYSWRMCDKNGLRKDILRQDSKHSTAMW